MKKHLALLLSLLLLLTACAAPEKAPEPVREQPAVETPAPEPTPEPIPEDNLFVFTRENLPVLDGSTSMVPLGQAVTAALLGERQDTVSDLIDFHRTTESFRYLMRGDSDLLLVAEPNRIVFEEMEQIGFAYEMQPIAKEALVFIVNSNNPIESLTVSQLQQIYTGQITNWSQVGGNDVEIVAFQRNATSGSQVLMDKLVMGDLEMMEAPQEWVPGEMDTLMAGVKGYEDSAAAIGYSVYYYAEDMRMAEGMKILSIEGVEPTDDTIAADEYPLINPYFAVIGAEAPAESPTRILYDWLVSADGQMVLESQGYVPVGGSAEETAVFMDPSGLSGFDQPQEIYTRRTEAFAGELTAGDYGLLRPYYGSRAAFDMTIYGSSGIFNGNMGLIDSEGAIVVDPVYTEVGMLYDRTSGKPAPYYLLYQECWEDNDWGGWMGSRIGICSLDGTFVLPCEYEAAFYSHGYLVTVTDWEAGLFQIRDSEGSLLLDSAAWPQRPAIFLSDGMGNMTVTEELIGVTVLTDPETWDTKFHLYSWDGTLITGAYDWVDLSGEAPYACGEWGSGDCGYLDAYGKETLPADYDSVGSFLQGKAVVRRGSAEQVIDPAGEILWEPPHQPVYTIPTPQGYYYSCPVGELDTRYFDSSFQQLYPDSDHVAHLNGSRFLVWNDGVCTLTDGQRSVVLEGAEDPYRNYYSYDDGVEDLLLIQSFLQEKRSFWLLDGDLNLLAHAQDADLWTQVLPDRITGGGLAVIYDGDDFTAYPYDFFPLDYAGAPQLQGVNVLGVYGGWYLVEDEFTTGYMDENGNWLFRVNLMADMVD